MTMNAAVTTPPAVNVCLIGHGIVCGLTVHVNPNCDIEVSSGTVITPGGTVIPLEKQCFSYYLSEPSKEVQTYFPHEVSSKNRSNRSVLELVPTTGYHPKTTDSLKQQNPYDLPTRNLLTDKIMVVLIDEYDHNKRYFLLVSPSLLLEKGDPELLKEVKELSKIEILETNKGLFNRPRKSAVTYSNEVIEQAVRPYLQLPEVEVPRFGYKKLAIKDTSQPFGIDNFVNPFTKIGTFEAIFEEYKAILDDLVPELEAALEKLHHLYGNQLTHKGAQYWAAYRAILVQKWQVFLEAGEHLYYIQYFYDWLVDLVKAYDELCQALSKFVGKCHCEPRSSDSKSQNQYTFIRLGPVLGGSTSYTPVLFRDYFVPPLIDGQNAEHWNEIKFLHWRMMMMIWTFDLPQLKLDEKVLVKGWFIVPAKEFEDSTGYFEKTDANKDTKTNLEDVPVKFTPSQTPDTLLSDQAIPYYYPLDADSPYSLHRYWNYGLTQMNRTRHIRSYNAIEDRDSFTAIKEGKFHKDAQFPLAYHLRNYPFLRAEGHIGKILKKVELTENDVPIVKMDMTLWQTLIEQYNLTLQVVAVSLSELQQLVLKARPALNFAVNLGFEHIGGVEHGQTLLLVYVDKGEQIELNECKKDDAPEIEPFMILADFTIPTLSVFDVK